MNPPHLSINLPFHSNELEQALDSKENVHKERISKAIEIHGDIVSRALIHIRQLEQRIVEQQSIIANLQETEKQTKRRVNKKMNN